MGRPFEALVREIGAYNCRHLAVVLQEGRKT